MARSESKAIMGYLPVEAKHHEAITSLITPASPATRLLDAFAGDGYFLDVAAKAWNVTPYANELDQTRAEACMTRFGPKQAVRGDAERLRASNNAFGIAWINPPYDHDRTAVAGNKRVELAMLRHSWKWVQAQGIILWCVYQQHVTEDAMAFISANSQAVDLWALPGKHQNEYDQIVLVAIKGRPFNQMDLYNKLVDQKNKPRPLVIQSEAIYKAPAPISKSQRFYFAPDDIDDKTGMTLIEQYGAWGSQGFQDLLAVPQPETQEEPLVMPRPGHTALVLSSGFANGAVLDTVEYGQVALRSKIEVREEVTQVSVEPDANDPEREVKKTTRRLKPNTQITLLGEDGTLVEMEGDEALLNFIKTNRRELAKHMNERFDPIYKFDFAGIGRYLDGIRLKGKYELYIPQKHVTAAIVSGFKKIKGQLLIGQMGVGKTAIAGSTAIAVAGQIVSDLQDDIQDDQVILIVCPPHLIEKWERELYSIKENIYIKRIKRHEDVKTFMAKATKLGAGIPKIGLIKRDMTKLGSGYEPAVKWRRVAQAMWNHKDPTPEGYADKDRIQLVKVPQCAGCGEKITYEHKGNKVVASKRWLKDGRRTCERCHTPLWQEKRDKTSKPKLGHKYPTKNPRYRIDEYIKWRYPNRVYLLIWDEIHEAANGDSGNGEAFGRLANVSQKILGLTGTPFNGRASSMFNIEYHINAKTRQVYPWGGAQRLSRKLDGIQTVVESSSNQRGRSESRWVADMGIREQVIEERPQYNRETGAYTGTSTYERPYQEAPGCSPKLIGWLLNHSVFFSLKDLGKNLPRYTEIAHPVTMDDDIASEYDRTRSLLKDYLVQRRWEGDSTFRGSYLQWNMGWPNATFRPMDVIHNIRHPISGLKQPHIVTQLPSFGENRLYNKEQALIELVQDRLTNKRPVVIYVRQSATKDIQPRLEKIIRENVPAAKPYILKNTVSAERREKVIEQQVKAGVNVLICNPELVKTGLDLLAFSTLIFYEIVFNLSTLLQAASRSYRLNQEADECEVVFMFYEGTMEHTAVQLMSRKQRAAKILTGDTGLTGLDALTEGEGGFEAALLNAITGEDELIDPRDLFKQDVTEDEITAEDNAFWNVHVDEMSAGVMDVNFASTIREEEIGIPEIDIKRATTASLPAISPTSEALHPLTNLIVSDDELDSILASMEIDDSSADSEDDLLIKFATEELGAVVSDEPLPLRPVAQHNSQIDRQHRYVSQYLETISDVPQDRLRKVIPRLLTLVREGEWDDVEEVKKVAGMLEDQFLTSDAMKDRLTRRVASWMRQKRLIISEDAGDIAQRVIDLSLMAFDLIPLQIDIFEAMRITQKAEIARRVQANAPQLNQQAKTKRKKLDLLALPEDDPQPSKGEGIRHQLELFS